MNRDAGVPAMVPVAIGGCFAAYHWAPGGAALILPGLGVEASTTVRVWRDLSRRLAARDVASLRPELPGTGDAAGVSEDPEIIAAWQDAVRDCAAWLAARHGGRVTLIGCRFGALLALDALAAGVTADRLVVLAPPASGNAFARELRVRANIEGRGTSSERPGFVAAAGLVLAEAGLAAIARLPRRPPDGTPLPPVTLFNPLQDGPERGWVRDWHTAGAMIETRPFPGHDEFLRRPYMDMRSPVEVLEAVAALPAPIPVQALPPPAPAGIAVPEGREEPLWFGSTPRRFGILCRPARPRDGAPAVVLPSVASHPRSGSDRGWAELARRLAQVGIASLRFDQAGVGESEGADGGDPICDAYRPLHAEGVTGAVAALAALGFDRAVVIGLCSGAYQAWHAAALDTRIVGIMVANPQHIRRVRRLTRAALITVSASRYRDSPRQAVAALRGQVRRVRRGEKRFGDFVRDLAAFAGRTAGEAARHMARRLGISGQGTWQARQHLATLLGRGCRVHFVFSEEDDGLKGFHAAFGLPARLADGACLTKIPDADHNFAHGTAREALFDLAIGFANSALPMQAGPAAKQAGPFGSLSPAT